VFEAFNEEGQEFGARRLIEVVHAGRSRTAREVADAIFDAVLEFGGGAPQNDDMTAVVVKITA
jgi:serine phosphatase RsbU (regulator of sigma subunit)